MSGGPDNQAFTLTTGIVGEMAIFRQLTVWLCAVALGIASHQDVTFRTDKTLVILVELRRLSEEQFPPVETQHPLRRMTRIFGETHFHQTKKTKCPS